MYDTDETMTIREMCDAFDVTPRTLRFYEAKELLFPIREGQKRLFTKRDRARLKLILRGKRFGFSLEEIRQLLDLYDIGDQQQTQLVRTFEIAKERLRDMEAPARRAERSHRRPARNSSPGVKKILASMTTENRKRGVICPPPTDRPFRTERPNAQLYRPHQRSCSFVSCTTC